MWIQVNKSFGVFARASPSYSVLHPRFIQEHLLDVNAPKKLNYAASWAGSAEASHLIHAQSCIQHAPHPRCCLSSVSVLWMNMHYSTLIHSACACEQRRDEDSTRTSTPGRYKTQKIQPCKEKGDTLYICKSPDPLHPKTSLFCSASTPLSPWLSKENLKTRLKGNRHQ